MVQKDFHKLLTLLPSLPLHPCLIKTLFLLKLDPQPHKRQVILRFVYLCCVNAVKRKKYSQAPKRSNLRLLFIDKPVNEKIDMMIVTALC